MRARAALAAAAALLLLAGVCDCAMYKVGDLDAWGLPPASKPDVYKRWGKSIHLALGDSIWFLYPPSHDSVVQVTAQAFASCDVSSPVLRLADGNSVFNLTAPGRAYYTSGAPGRCRKGQKLTVDVPMANGTRLPPSANDLAALAPSAVGAEAQPPAAFVLPALAPSDDEADSDDSAAALRAAAGAGSAAAAAALSFALALLL